MDAGRRGEPCSPVEFYGCEKWHGRTKRPYNAWILTIMRIYWKRDKEE